MAEFLEKLLIATSNSQELVDKRSIYSSIVIRQCVESLINGIPLIVFRFGIMYGGKISATLKDVCKLREMRLPVHVFKVQGDNRYKTSDSKVGSKDGQRIDAEAVSNISEISNRITSGEIRSGSIIAIVEMPFMFSESTQLERFRLLYRRFNNVY